MRIEYYALNSETTQDQLSAVVEGDEKENTNNQCNYFIVREEELDVPFQVSHWGFPRIITPNEFENLALKKVENEVPSAQDQLINKIKRLMDNLEKNSEMICIKLGWAERGENQNFTIHLSEMTKSCQKLKELDLSGLNISSIPFAIGNLKKVISVDISNNPYMTQFPEILKQLPKLKSVKCYNTPLESFPEWTSKIELFSSVVIEQSQTEL